MIKLDFLAPIGMIAFDRFAFAINAIATVEAESEGVVITFIGGKTLHLTAAESAGFKAVVEGAIRQAKFAANLVK